jgi:hypothetical protein
LAQVQAESNALTFYGKNGPIETVSGKGAGRFPTAQAVVGDLWDILFTLDGEMTSGQDDASIHYLPQAERNACA